MENLKLVDGILEDIKSLKIKIVKLQNYEKASILRSMEKDLIEEREKMIKESISIVNDHNAGCTVFFKNMPNIIAEGETEDKAI